MTIAVDFDGTCVAHRFPNIGKDIGAQEVLKKLVNEGHQLILFTMRSDISNPKSKDYEIESKGGNYLTDAVNWFKTNNIPLYGINKNPTQSNWTKSPKAYAQIYIDDAALGCPLIYDDMSEKPYVDWKKVEQYFKELNLI
jgi:hypothetical protein